MARAGDMELARALLKKRANVNFWTTVSESSLLAPYDVQICESNVVFVEGSVAITLCSAVRPGADDTTAASVWSRCQRPVKKSKYKYKSICLS